MAQSPYSRGSATLGPGPVPHTGNPELEAFLSEEMTRIWTALNYGQLQMLQLEPLQATPARTIDGMICFFVENVVAPQRGLYEYKAGAWSKL